MKLNFVPDICCQNLPYEITLYMKYVMNLKVLEKPDYCYLRKLFKNGIEKNLGGVKNIGFDWVVKAMLSSVQVNTDTNHSTLTKASKNFDKFKSNSFNKIIEESEILDMKISDNSKVTDNLSEKTSQLDQNKSDKKSRSFSQNSDKIQKELLESESCNFNSSQISETDEIDDSTTNS